MWKFRMRGALLQSLNPLLQQERVVGDDMKCGIRRRVRISAGGGHQIATFLGKELMPAVQIPGIEQLGFEKQELLDARPGWTIPGSHAATFELLRRRFCHSSRSEEHTAELQTLIRISYAVFGLNKNKKTHE